MLTIAGKTIQVGDTAQFPIGRLGDDQVDRHRFEVTAFVSNGCVTVRRLHDGFERTIAIHWFETYRTYETETEYYKRRPFAGTFEIIRKAKLAHVRASRLRAARLQTDASLPGYYVSARHGKRYVFLLGPFADHYTALQLVDVGRSLASPFDHYCEYGYGTCLAPDSAKPGRFNSVLENGNV